MVHQSWYATTSKNGRVPYYSFTNKLVIFIELILEFKTITAILTIFVFTSIPFSHVHATSTIHIFCYFFHLVRKLILMRYSSVLSSQVIPISPIWSGTDLTILSRSTYSTISARKRLPLIKLDNQSPLKTLQYILNMILYLENRVTKLTLTEFITDDILELVEDLLFRMHKPCIWAICMTCTRILVPFWILRANHVSK